MPCPPIAMTRSALMSAITLSLLASANSRAAAQQDRLGADATTTPVGVHTHIGRRISYVCPAVTSAQIASVEVWGTDIYSSDSPICIAAIHAGVLQAGRPGLVTIVVASGADTFTGSARNGVTTKDYGPNTTSYTFDRTGAPGQLDWFTTGLGIPETFTASIFVACPGGGAMTSQIWGSDVYNEDSSICTAALHAGLITRANGGNFFVTRDTGLKNYDAVDRNGVKSTVWSGGKASFKVGATSTTLIATQAVTVPAVSGTSPSPAPIREPIATPTVMTTICSPGVTKPGSGPSSVFANLALMSPLGADLQWPAVFGAAGYVVERVLASGGTPAKLASTCEHEDWFIRKTDTDNVETISYKDRSGGLQAGETYAYVVRAFGSAGQMGWSSTHWTAPTLPLLRVSSVDAKGSTVTVHWSIDNKDPVTTYNLYQPNDFVVKSEYGYYKTLNMGQVGGTCGCTHTILGVPLGAHTFTVEARWAPDVKSSGSKTVTIAP
jgi:hypothetical protein